MCSAANSANNSFWWPSRVWWKSDLCTPTPWRFWAGVMWTFEFFVLCLCIVSIVLHCIAHDLSVSISLLTIYYSQSLQISHCIPNMVIATHPTRWPTLVPAFAWCTPWQQHIIVQGSGYTSWRLFNFSPHYHSHSHPWLTQISSGHVSWTVF